MLLHARRPSEENEDSETLKASDEEAEPDGPGPAGPGSVEPDARALHNYLLQHGVGVAPSENGSHRCRFRFKRKTMHVFHNSKEKPMLPETKFKTL